MAAEQGNHSGSFSGPGNKAIATTLLEWLSTQGRPTARDRALRALGTEGEDLAAAPIWLADSAIPALFLAGEIEPGLARVAGHRLVTPDVTGLKLYALGLATPEKAYRRIQSLLPRESASSTWTVEAIEGRGARIRFDQGEGAESQVRVATSLCSLRTGMLEAIPGLYGLLPARVDHWTCLARGDDACRYDVNWQATTHAGKKIGAALGFGAAAGIASAQFFLNAGLSIVNTVISAGLFMILGPTLGAVQDLRRQLEAVAGARRGHLALFDQVDDALATKLDALARADAKFEPEPDSRPTRTAGDRNAQVAEANPTPSGDVLLIAQQIHATAGDLECWFDARDAERVGSGISDERGLVRDIREWATRLGQLGDAEGTGTRSRMDLVRLVTRAVATARPGLPPSSVVKIDADPDLPSIECDPVQIEHLVVQLVQNAIEASVELSETPEVILRLNGAPRGLELVVEDRGVGIESSAIDEVFDPFFGDRPAGAGHGIGLTVCLRIVERHGGELRIANQARAGTRVTVWLPVKAPAAASSAEEAS